MPDDVAKWLEELGLGEYVAAFAEHAIDKEVLPDLADVDLEKVGVKLGHRKKLLKAIAALAAEKAPAPALSSEKPTAPPPHEVDETLAAWERHPGERKPVTVLFADITGSTALTEKLDAEETYELIYGATQRMCAAVEDNRGTVCRFMGDGVMAMFGAPLGSERHALEACRAALDIQARLDDYSKALQTSHGKGLQARVGLHSGEVVVLRVGIDPDHPEYDASGPTVPLAARMEQAAEPGRVLMTKATRMLAGDLVESDAHVPVTVKGLLASGGVRVARDPLRGYEGRDAPSVCGPGSRARTVSGRTRGVSG
jgi:class 3 adenylate cyclase